MKTRNLWLTIFGAAAIAAGAAVTHADDKKGVAADLEHYFPVRAALAEDKIEGVKEHADALAKSADKAVVKAAKGLSDAKDLDAARKSFGEVSKALIADVEAATKKGEKLEVYVFECPMAKPYGRWLQETKDIGNPYMGQKMPTCGKLIASTGAPAEGTGAKYVCGMCGVSQDTPGKCPKCGMALKKQGGDGH